MLCTSRPAPTASVSAAAISAAISRPRHRATERTPDVVSALARSVGAVSPRQSWTAGSSPATIPVIAARAKVTASTRGLSARSSIRGIVTGASDASRLRVQTPHSRPAAPPNMPRIEAAEREIDRDLRARRAEGHADRDLTPLSDGAYDQQVREVDARDHQHEPDGAEHDQQRRPHAAHDLVVQRRDRGREIAVGLRAAPAEIVREDAQLLARALDRDVRLQASHHADAAPAPGPAGSSKAAGTRKSIG